MILENSIFYRKLAEKAESLIVAGRGNSARRLLQENIKPKKLPREEIVKFAKLARRLNMTAFALKILHPITSPDLKLDKPLNSEELAIYGAVQTKFGALDQALKTLQSIESSSDHSPEVDLFLAYNFIARWDYKKAIPHLRRYCKSHRITKYEETIGRVNLAAAYLFERNYGAGTKVLSDIIKLTKENNWHLLYGNSLELRAQLAISEQDWSTAKHYLNLGEKYIADPSNIYRFFIEKWKSVLELKTNCSKENIDKLIKIKQQAIHRKHWETVRDCDYFLADGLSDHTLFTKIYCGTPYNGFRKRIQREYGRISPGRIYSWDIFTGEKNPTEAPTLNVPLGSCNEASLKPNQVPHRLLANLTSDFYRPTSLGTLFHNLFPDEYFNPYTSPKRVTFAVERLRRWIHQANLPLAINSVAGEFTLTASGPIRIEVNPNLKTKAPQNLNDTDILLTRLRKYFDGRSFNSQMAAEALSLSRSSLNPILSQALKTQNLKKMGNGKSIRYIF